ncbi:MAG: hypothetical protein HY904_09250 [Deltaproteobacteria bacterium]|nr:hypothetical protein [Deltaproteobacteria bacterium]
MAIVQLSKMVTDKLKSSTSVVNAARTHATRIGTQLAAEINEPGVAPILEKVVQRHADKLETATRTMTAADEKHVQELGDDNEPRARRDAAAEQTHALLLDTKEALTGAFGAEFVARLGLGGTVPVDPVAISRTAALVLTNLGTLPAPASRLPGYAYNAAAFSNPLKTRHDALTAALADVARESKEADATLAEKTRAVEAYDTTFSRVANLTSALLEAVDEKDLAGKVRPSLRRPGQTQGDVGLEAPPQG